MQHPAPLTVGRVREIAWFDSPCSQEEIDTCEQQLKDDLRTVERQLVGEYRQDRRPVLLAERRAIKDLLRRIEHRQAQRVVLLDGRVIEGRMTVVCDDEYVAREDAMLQQQRAEVIEQYGSEEAYSEAMLEDTKRLRAERRQMMRQQRVARVRRSRRIPRR